MAYEPQTRFGATVYQTRFKGHLGVEWTEWNVMEKPER